MSMADRDGQIWHDGKLVPWREATTHVLEERVGHPGEVGYEQAFVSAVVVIGNRDTHACHERALVAVGAARALRRLGKGSVSVVMPQHIG